MSNNGKCKNVAHKLWTTYKTDFIKQSTGNKKYIPLNLQQKCSSSRKKKHCEIKWHCLKKTVTNYKSLNGQHLH